MTDIFITLFWFAAMFALGTGLGFYLAWSKKPKYPLVGTLFINHNDPAKELMTFNFNRWSDEIETMGYILFNVQTDKDEDSNPKNSQGKNF